MVSVFERFNVLWKYSVFLFHRNHFKEKSPFGCSVSLRHSELLSFSSHFGLVIANKTTYICWTSCPQTKLVKQKADVWFATVCIWWALRGPVAESNGMCWVGIGCACTLYSEIRESTHINSQHCTYRDSPQIQKKSSLRPGRAASGSICSFFMVNYKQNGEWESNGTDFK